MALIPYRKRDRGELANLHREIDNLFNSSDRSCRRGFNLPAAFF